MHMWNLETKIKQKQTHRYRQKANNGCQKEGEWEYK